MKQERRTLPVELRAKGRRLEGYAATFNTPTVIGESFTEVIAPGAFAATLTANPDILALVDHDLTRLLGRTGASTLRLTEDSRGLAFEIDLPATQLGNDILALAERGDLGGMSFGFMVTDERRERLQYTRQKTGRMKSPVLIGLPIAPELRAVLDRLPKEAGTFLQTKEGRQRSAKSLTGDMRAWCDLAGLPECNNHGLRKAIARRMARVQMPS